MSLMAMSASQSSMFTFESTVHCSHVLRSLDEQRRQDALCDVTVAAEGQSFRAHRSVLASCSDYFAHRISSLAQHGAVITLPQEVTAAGFEPLLKFAYTSKLHFRKDNVLEIRNSASILGFRDLDEACFDFLLPKFFSTSKASGPFSRKTCCKKKCKRRLSKEGCGLDADDVWLGEKEVKPVADSPSQQEVSWLSNKAVTREMGSQSSTDTRSPVPEGIKNTFMQCPKYRKFQRACGKENCVIASSVIRDGCNLSCMPCSSRASSNNESDIEFPSKSTADTTRQSKEGADDSWKTEIHDKKTEEKALEAQSKREDAHVPMKDEREGKWDEKERETDILRTEEEMEHTAGFRSLGRSSVQRVSVGSSTVLGAGSSGLILSHCPLKALAEGCALAMSVGHERFVMDIKEDKKTKDSGALEPVSMLQESEEQEEAEEKRVNTARKEGGNREQTGTVERVTLLINNVRDKSSREVAENLAKPLQANLHDPDVGSSSEIGIKQVQSTSLEWLKHVNISTSSSSCPFFEDFQDQRKCSWKGTRLSECEGASQSGASLNSGEDGDSETETEGDSESYARERARQVQLPFSVDWIVDLSRNDFQQLLKQQVLTAEQLEFVHDMRRRSKNRLAAQRCRKRKLDCIYNLQCEIHKLKTEREKLLMEKSQLSQLKLKTCHTVTALCQKVCNEANLQPEQLQVLAKYTTPDCPLASFFPNIDSLLSQPGFPLESESSLSACSVCPNKYTAFEETSSTSSRDTGDGQYSPSRIPSTTQCVQFY